MTSLVISGVPQGQKRARTEWKPFMLTNSCRFVMNFSIQEKSFPVIPHIFSF